MKEELTDQEKIDKTFKAVQRMELISTIKTVVIILGFLGVVAYLDEIIKVPNILKQ